MKWEIDDNKQIHPQIVEEITKRIIQGIYSPGEKIPSVRELAIEARVNPNTMQKALVELEDSQIIVTKRTTGKFVTTDETLLKEIEVSLSILIVKEFVKRMQDLKINNKTIITMIESEIKHDQNK